MKFKNRKSLVAIFAVAGLLFITAGVSYAFFSYSRNGTTSNTIESGVIKFIYNESSRVGNGISLTDAMPMPDSVGKAQDKYFDFSVTGTSGTAKIDYEITARKTAGSDNLDEYVKMYLTGVNGNNETQKVLSIYDDLNDSTNQLAQNHTEKTLYRGSIPAGATNYTENYRLRMWLNDDLNDGSIINYTQTETGVCSDITITNELDCVAAHEDWTRTAVSASNQIFTIKVNVYANGEMATQQEIATANSTSVNGLVLDGASLVPTLNDDPTRNYDYYQTVTLDHMDISLDIELSNEDASYIIEPITATEANNIRQIAATSTFNIKNGDNYFKITVTSANRQQTDIYVLKLVATITDVTISGDSILSILRDNDLESGNYIFKINDKTESYPVHLYNYNGDQNWSSANIPMPNGFGLPADIGTASANAKRMVIVKVNGNLINGTTIKPYSTSYGGPKGFALYVTGTLTNNGTIDNSRGGKHAGENVYLWKNDNGTYEYVPKTGAKGGTAVNNNNGVNGAAGTNTSIALTTQKRRATGGGGTGAHSSGTNAKGNGGTGTSYSGGAGAGASYVNDVLNASSVGGAGSDAVSNNGIVSGGAGNPGGAGAKGGNKGSNGTGGLLVIFANSITNNKIISAKGATGGSYSSTSGFGGGGSGGGSINIFYKVSYTSGSSASISAAGGAGGEGNNPVNGKGTGGAGGTGSYSTLKIN